MFKTDIKVRLSTKNIQNINSRQAIL